MFQLVRVNPQLHFAWEQFIFFIVVHASYSQQTCHQLLRAVYGTGMLFNLQTDLNICHTKVTGHADSYIKYFTKSRTPATVAYFTQQFYFIVYSFVYQPQSSSSFSYNFSCHSKLQAMLQSLCLLQHPAHHGAEAKCFVETSVCFYLCGFGTTCMQVCLKTCDSRSHLLCCFQHCKCSIIGSQQAL